MIDEITIFDGDRIGPVRSDADQIVTYDAQEPQFYVSINLQDGSTARDAWELQEDVADLTAADLQEERYAELLERRQRLGVDGDIREIAEDPVIARYATDRFMYEDGDTTGYVMSPEQPLLVRIGGTTPPYDLEEEEWVQEDLNTLLERLDENGMLAINENKLSHVLDFQAGAFLGQFAEEHDYRTDPETDSPNSGTARYDTLEHYLAIEDALPDQLKALRALYTENDPRIHDKPDRAKLDFITGTTTYAEQLLEDIQTALADETPVTLHRRPGIGAALDDIDAFNTAYSDEKEAAEHTGISPYSIVHDFSAQDLLDLLYEKINPSYNAEAIYRFCEENDGDDINGEAITYLAMNAEEDTIRLPDMGNVRGVGNYLEDTHLIVDGDIKEWFGKNMKSGRIDVKGNIQENYSSRLTKAWIAFDAEGGEIYLHQGDRVSNRGDGDIYRKRLRGRMDSWKKA